MDIHSLYFIEIIGAVLDHFPVIQKHAFVVIVFDAIAGHSISRKLYAVFSSRRAIRGTAEIMDQWIREAGAVAELKGVS